MSCTGCTAKFKIFNKELSCELCNLSFCSKCLSKTSSQKVCQKCLAKANANTDIDPPALLLKRLELLENPAKPPVTVFKADHKFASLKRGLSLEDQKMVERLEKLKENRKLEVVPSESEIKERLLILQGASGASSSTTGKKDVVTIAPPKTTQQEVDDLLLEYLDEMKLDQNTVDLVQVPELNVQCQSEMTESSDSEDDNKAAASYVERAMEEAALPECEEMGLASPRISPIQWEPAESELPWCEMCNGDSTIRCLGCDGALYCQRCFKQGHDYFELKSHKTLPFSSKSET